MQERSCPLGIVMQAVISQPFSVILDWLVATVMWLTVLHRSWCMHDVASVVGTHASRVYIAFCCGCARAESGLRCSAGSDAVVCLIVSGVVVVQLTGRNSIPRRSGR